MTILSLRNIDNHEAWFLVRSRCGRVNIKPDSSNEGLFFEEPFYDIFPSEEKVTMLTGGAANAAPATVAARPAASVAAVRELARRPGGAYLRVLMWFMAVRVESKPGSIPRLRAIVAGRRCLFSGPAW